MYFDAIDRLHQANLTFLRRQQFAVRRKRKDNRLVEWKAERWIVQYLEARGHRVARTTNNAPFDLFVDGVAVEVKGATWHKAHNGGGRYQAAIRNFEADIVIFDCINGTHHLFVIPMSAIRPRRALQITRFRVEKSQGQWLAFLDAWHYLDQAIARRNRNWQLPLL